MSKLDDILNYDVLVRLHPEVKAIHKGQIKDLFLELIGSAESIFQSRDELITRKQRFDELRQKVEAL